ncbi:MAG: response regulator transcription factor [Candidatus Melainabacteria bacterium]|nr:response regulator transcription factor [Candidatus Melainabacteria bacterium]
MAKLLLVEDDVDLAATIEAELLLERHTVDMMHNGLDGLEALKSSVYDAAILDWDLPGMAGIEILAKFRELGGVTPVIMLTGKSEISDKTTGLDAGADDYLTKPFNSRELAARIRSLLRRPPQVRSNTVEYAGITLDPSNFGAIRDGASTRLQPRDFALLEFFMRHPTEVFDVDALMDRVWKLDSDCSPPAVRMAITRIRKALDREGEESIIENLPRVGYKLRSKS